MAGIGESDGNVAKAFDGGSVAKNSGASHITIGGGEAHITTAVPGLQQGQNISIHTPVSGDGSVGPSSVADR